jgi:hypothetical protein
LVGAVGGGCGLGTDGHNEYDEKTRETCVGDPSTVKGVTQFYIRSSDHGKYKTVFANI